MDQDLVGRLMADMSPELLEFLRTKVNSFVKWDLVHFFHENPDVASTPEHIARRAGRDAETMRAELAELAGQGVLLQSQLGGKTVFLLSDDPGIRDLVRRFVEASGDRQFRFKAIYHIVRGMR
jgi:hypothetical protein